MNEKNAKGKSGFWKTLKMYRKKCFRKIFVLYEVEEKWAVTLIQPIYELPHITTLSFKKI